MSAATRLQDLALRLSEQSSTLVRSEIELAKAELRDSAMTFARAAALGAAAAVFVVVGVLALVEAIILALALTMPAWLAALIVALALFLIGAIVAFVAKRQVESGPQGPQRAVAEAKATADALREAALGAPPEPEPVASVTTSANGDGTAT
jgi:hypothetical protein